MLSTEYLDRARRLTSTGTDYALAKLLDVSEAAINKYRRGHRVIDNAMALKLSELLKVPLEAIIAAAEIDRAKTPEDAQKWRERLKALASIAAVAFGSWAMIGPTGDASARPDWIGYSTFGTMHPDQHEKATHETNTNYTQWLIKALLNLGAKMRGWHDSLRSPCLPQRANA